MFDILIGLGLIYVAIRYGLAPKSGQPTPLLSGGVGVVISILMILVGLGLITWSIMGRF